MPADNHPGDPLSTADAALEAAAVRLRESLTSLALSLRPFPAFWGMTSLQALELDPPLRSTEDRGCVVVDPEGRICQLDLRAMPGCVGITESDQVEELMELDLPADEFILYAITAIRLLRQELLRRQT